jgi:hypothetical protein
MFNFARLALYMITALVFYLIAGILIWETKYETVKMDKDHDEVSVERYKVFSFFSKFTSLKLS